MLFKGTFVGPASGKLGGIVASRNRGGSYLRKLSIPVNPQSIFQQTVRNAVSTLTSRWATLDQSVREGWGVYSDAVPMPDPFGDPRPIGALAMYVRCNVSRIQAGEPIVDNPPATLNLGDPPSMGDLSFTEDGGDVAIEWVNDSTLTSADKIVIYGSRPTAPTRTTPIGGNRFLAKIDGDEGSFIDDDYPFAPSIGQRVFFQARVLYADGRVSSLFRASVLVRQGGDG